MKDAIKYIIVLIIILIISTISFLFYLYKEPYIRLVIIFFTIGLIIALIPILKFKWYKEDHKSIVNYLILIIGTFSGVLFAIHFNQTHSYENILQVTKGNIFECQPMKNQANLILSDSINYRIYKDSLDLPVVLSNIFTMDVVLERISQTTLEYLCYCNSRLINLHRKLSEINNFNEFKNIASVYFQYLDKCFHILDNEIRYSFNNINKDELIKEARKIVPEYKYEYLNNQN